MSSFPKGAPRLRLFYVCRTRYDPGTRLIPAPVPVPMHCPAGCFTRISWKTGSRRSCLCPGSSHGPPVNHPSAPAAARSGDTETRLAPKRPPATPKRTGNHVKRAQGWQAAISANCPVILHRSKTDRSLLVLGIILAFCVSFLNSAINLHPGQDQAARLRPRPAGDRFQRTSGADHTRHIRVNKTVAMRKLMACRSPDIVARGMKRVLMDSHAWIIPARCRNPFPVPEQAPPASADRNRTCAPAPRSGNALHNA